MPEPGFQNSIPYLRAALSRKSKTSWLVRIDFYNEMAQLSGAVSCTSNAHFEILLRTSFCPDKVITVNACGDSTS